MTMTTTDKHRRNDSSTKRRSVCLFGTSANPPTGKSGHVGIVSHIASLTEYDQVWVLPVYQHMFAGKRSLAPFLDRIRMCQISFGDIPKVRVSECERICFERALTSRRNENDPSVTRVGTADLIEMLMDEHPDTDFTLALGMDTFMDLTDWKWRRSKDVLNLVQGRLLVFYRVTEGAAKNNGGDDGDAFSNNARRMELKERVKITNEEFTPPVEIPEGTDSALSGVKVLNVSSLTAVSSTLVRSSREDAFLLDCVMPGVLQFMKEKKLYAFQGE